MTEDLLQYDKLVERALKNVVREALRHVAEHGLRGAHHLYITFRTDHPGVMIPDELKSKYPVEMTIVLQYQFWDLLVGDEEFEVTLSFNDRQQRLVIPFSAINAFADPSVNFALQFQPTDAKPSDGAEPVTADAEPSANAVEEDGKGGDDTPTDNIIQIDTFRKK